MESVFQKKGVLSEFFVAAGNGNLNEAPYGCDVISGDGKSELNR
ncbi:MAG: hypothetical protein Q4C96_08370 [Planctomycetia bacterium]|nr:hypothetical protein [Planctomycetia bacterium]